MLIFNQSYLRGWPHLFAIAHFLWIFNKNLLFEQDENFRLKVEWGKFLVAFIIFLKVFFLGLTLQENFLLNRWKILGKRFFLKFLWNENLAQMNLICFHLNWEFRNHFWRNWKSKNDILVIHWYTNKVIFSQPDPADADFEISKHFIYFSQIFSIKAQIWNQLDPTKTINN